MGRTSTFGSEGDVGVTLGQEGELFTLGTRGDCWSSTYCATVFSIATSFLGSLPPEIGGRAGGALGVVVTGAEVPEVPELAHPESDAPTIAAMSPMMRPARPLDATVKIMTQEGLSMPVPHPN